MERLLRENSAAEFSELKDGVYYFTIRDAYGETASVCLSLWGKRRQFRSASFHLGLTSWQIGEAECKRFGDEWRSAIRATAPGLNWTKHRIRIPGGPDQIWVSIPKGHDGEWLYRAAQFVSNTDNLKRV